MLVRIALAAGFSCACLAGACGDDDAGSGPDAGSEEPVAIGGVRIDGTPDGTSAFASFQTGSRFRVEEGCAAPQYLPTPQMTVGDIAIRVNGGPVYTLSPDSAARYERASLDLLMPGDTVEVSTSGSNGVTKLSGTVVVPPGVNVVAPGENEVVPLDAPLLVEWTNEESDEGLVAFTLSGANSMTAACVARAASRRLTVPPVFLAGLNQGGPARLEILRLVQSSLDGDPARRAYLLACYGQRVTITAVP